MADHADIDHTGLTGVGVGDATAHIADATDAHDASAISFSPAGSIAATDVQAAIEEVASEAGGGIASTIVDAKGDLIAASAADTPARLAVGADDAFLIAASGQATGLAWRSAMTSWTPALTASSSNPTLGSGSFANGKYIQVGKLIIARAAIGFGSSGTGAGSGDYLVSLPVAAVTSGQICIGSGRIFDSSAGFFYAVGAEISTSTTVKLSRDGAGVVTQAAPFAWSTSDNIALVFMYEAA